MKTILITLLALQLPVVHAGTTEAESDVFSFDARDSVGTTEAESGVFSMDARGLGNAGSGGSVEFVLNTLGSAPTDLEIVGPSSVVAGSETDYKVIWHAGNSVIDVTSGARWRFLTGAPGNTGMVPPRFYAGETTTAATVRIVASYLAANGVSQETAPFSITITPRMQAMLTASRQSNTSGVVNLSTGVQGAAGAVVVKWDLDNDGQFDDATGETVTRDYGTWTGTTKVKVEVSDGQGNRRVEERSVVLNKPPVANQPVTTKPAYDPANFSLLLPNAARSDFKFNAPPADDPNASPLNRRNSGLIVIAHGLYSDARNDWLREMGAAVESRCDDLGLTPPDIALLDWSNLAGDPSELPPEQQAMLKMLLARASNGNFVAAGTGAIGEGINFVFDLWWVKKFGITAGQSLASWIYQNSRIGGTPQIDADRPIHLIGHSAGGFVVGEAAKLLKHPSDASFQPVHVDLVTLLDTPFPPKDHFALGAKRYPNPGTVERYISSFYGDLDELSAWFTTPHTWYRRSYRLKSVSPIDNFSVGSGGHGYAYEWFTRKTIRNSENPEAELERDGFAWSPIINPGTRISKPVATAGPLFGPPPAPPELSDIVPTDWETFGNAGEASGTWTLTEFDDAGIWKDLALPMTAGALSFEFHFSAAGDGDFLAVHFGDSPALYQGLDLVLSRDAWLPVEIPLEMLPALNGKLVFTLVSRGGVNARVQLRNIRITQSDDADSDGLPMAAEASAGSDPRNPDTDGDGISDGDEVVTYGTDPLRADTDDDGQPDAAEVAAGTNPLANGSVFRVTSIQPTPQGGMVLQWTGAEGKTYRVLRSAELGTNNFETLAFGVPGVAPQTSFTDSNPPPLRAFYWIEVE